MRASTAHRALQELHRGRAELQKGRQILPVYLGPGSGRRAHIACKAVGALRGVAGVLISQFHGNWSLQACLAWAGSASSGLNSVGENMATGVGHPGPFDEQLAFTASTHMSGPPAETPWC